MTDFQIPRSSGGIGLRSKYLEYFLVDVPQTSVGWLEVHPENYLYHYPNRRKLLQISENYPISFHCVSLSLGSIELPSHDFLLLLKRLIHDIQPFIVSDHLSWSTLGHHGYNDLYPMPLTEESLDQMVLNIRVLQDFFDRQLLIENPSTYLTFNENTFNEPEFLNALVTATGCGILLDVNNLYVQSVNHGWKVDEYFHQLNWSAVREFHVAGHVVSKDGSFLIDTHSRPVSDAVWSIYQKAMEYQPEAFTLIEWDSDLPEIDVLLNQLEIAKTYGMKLCTV
jgi:uncharacterized protein (UPF0276 family)